MKTCPYCKEQIANDAKICPICGEKQRMSFKFNPLLIKWIIIIFVSILVITGISIGILNVISKDNSSYLQVIPEHEAVNPSESSIYPKNALEIIIKQKEKLDIYLNEQHFKSSKDKAVLTFIDNIKYYTQIFNESNELKIFRLEEYDNSLSDMNTTLISGKKDKVLGVWVVPEVKEYDYGYKHIEKLTITDPVIPCIRLVYAGEGVFVAEPNYKFLNDTYSKYLGKDLSEYLKLMSKEQEILGDNTYMLDGAASIGMADISKLIIMWQDFTDKHQNFIKIDNVKNNLFTYTNEFIKCSWMDINPGYIPEAKRAYENFLKTGKRNTETYKIISKQYDILKSHNFKFCDECQSYYNEIYEKYIENN